MAEFEYQNSEAFNTVIRLAATVAVGRLKIVSNLKASADAQTKAFEQAGMASRAHRRRVAAAKGGPGGALPRCPGRNCPVPCVVARPRCCHERERRGLRDRVRTRGAGHRQVNAAIRVLERGPGGGATRAARPSRPARVAEDFAPPRPVVLPGGTLDDRTKKRILTGIRPTGSLHLGHYAGALENWVKLQNEYDCHFLIADYQVSDYADDISRVRDSVWEVALDFLAVGLDPETSCFVIESLVPEHAELTLHLSWFLPLGMLSRNPTLKSEMEAIEGGDEKSAGKSVPVAFYNYPVMQVANILMPRAHLVPVGEDQLPHIELTRETARRFNQRFKPVFPEPEALVGRVARLVGTDGNAKMSKSRGNAINLKDDAATVRKAVMGMYGGPPRGRERARQSMRTRSSSTTTRSTPTATEVEDLKERYETVGVGNKELKETADRRPQHLPRSHPRPARAHYEANMPLVRDVLEHGSKRARAIASDTMESVRDAPTSAIWQVPGETR